MTLTYENIIVMRGFDMGIKFKGVRSNNLNNFCDLFHLTNLLKSETCSTKTHALLPNLILTNKQSSFNKRLVCQ